MLKLKSMIYFLNNRHDIIEILLKVALKTINPNQTYN
jgi:hypothetical protein